MVLLLDAQSKEKVASVTNFFRYFCVQNPLFRLHFTRKNVTSPPSDTNNKLIMNATLSLQDLWNQILALPARDRHWLQDKLNVYESEESKEEVPCRYSVEEMRQRLLQVETRILQGDPGLTEEEVEKELLEEMPWLK